MLLGRCAFMRFHALSFVFVRFHFRLLLFSYFLNAPQLFSYFYLQFSHPEKFVNFLEGLDANL